MKFANISLQNNSFSNLGDQAQLLAVDYIYQQMGISKQDIIYIDTHETDTYDGEPVVLPINMPLCDYREHGFAERFSKKITPVFLGLELFRDSLQPEEVEYFKRFEPIGCRDERMYDLLQKYGVKSYLGGCSTVVFPRRTPIDSKTRKKVFILDPPEQVIKFIPKNILENACFETQYIHNPGSDSRSLAVERYKQYSAEAAMVITSLLHAAIPCMAMGIPVILVRDQVSARFSWMENLLHIYTPNEYEKIDWSPAPVDYEPHKKLVTSLIMKRLEGKECSDELRAVHSFYMNRDRHEYVSEWLEPIKKFTESEWKCKEGHYKYGVWGLTDIAEAIIDYISQKYPNAELCHVYDKSRFLNLRGIVAQHPNNIKDYPDEVVFAIPSVLSVQARKFFEEMGRPENSYVLY